MANMLRSLTLLCVALSYAVALNPVILVPGDGGSQLKARLNKTTSVHYVCAKTSGWYDIWLNLEQMVPGLIDCWVDNIRLVYDNRTRTTSNSPGVEIDAPGFGNDTATVEYLDSSMRSFSVYFAKVAARLMALGYERGVNMHGAPYDFRKAANEHGAFMTSLKNLVESTYARNKQQPVIFICHSMGCPMTLYFLNRQTQAWKDKHVRSFISMAGVWAGTVRAMKVYSIGDNLGTWVLSSSSLKIEQRSNPSLAWLMPSDQFWKKDEVLVQSSNVNITVKNIETFYERLGHPDGYEMYKDVKDLVRKMEPPNVEVYCLHGAGVPTTEQMVYSKFPDSTPVLKTGDGDGTVNLRSLLGCTRWGGSADTATATAGRQKQPVHHHVFQKTDHLQILRDDAAVEFVKNVVKTILAEDDRNGDDLRATPTPSQEEKVWPIIDIVP